MMRQDPNTAQCVVGIIGRSLEHTLSPLMHNTASEELKLNFTYGVCQINPEMIPHFFATMRKLKLRGVNVTLPYKQVVMEYLDDISDEAKAIGAVNTIVLHNGVLTGYNTDSYGVYYALNPHYKAITNSTVIVIGAGGASRAVIYALGTFFTPKKIIVVNRTAETATNICAEFNKQFNKIEFQGERSFDLIAKEAGASAAIINTTSVGMTPKIDGNPLPTNVTIQKNQIIFDIVYTPITTSLLVAASEAGAQTVSGIDMLLGQGQKAFELFTGKSFPMDVTRSVLLKNLIQGKRA